MSDDQDIFAEYHADQAEADAKAEQESQTAENNHHMRQCANALLKREKNAERITETLRQIIDKG